jgi:hypothetical protein
VRTHAKAYTLTQAKALLAVAKRHYIIKNYFSRKDEEVRAEFFDAVK